MKYLKSSKINRFILALVTISLVVSFSSVPKKTNAWVGVSDVHIESATNILKFLDEAWEAYLESEAWWKEWILDPLFYVVAQELLSDITESTVNWINSGFEGSPLYDINFADSIKDGLNEASGVLIDKMGGAELCTDLKEGLGISFSYEKPYALKMKCTLNDVIDNVEDFYSDFTTGGWKTWVTLSVEPQNNPYGAYITTADRYGQLRAEKAKEAKNEIKTGKPFKTCDEYSKDAQGNDTTNCKHWTIQTPGKTIEARMSAATGVDFGALQVADEMDEIIGALLQQAMKAIFEEGSSSDSSGTSGGGGLTNADLSEDVTPATIAEDIAALKIELQVYYDYFAVTSTALTNGLHNEMRQVIFTQRIKEENFWRLAQYCKNEGQTEATGISGAKYLKDIIESSQDVIQAQRSAGATEVNANIAAAKGLYSDGFTDTSTGSSITVKGVYDSLYATSNWSNVTSAILSAWERKLNDLKGIQRKDASDLKLSKMDRKTANDAYDDECCDIDLGMEVLCAANPFCGICNIGILGIDFCETVCPCSKMSEDCKYKTGNNYRYCQTEGVGLTAEQKTRSLGGQTCNRGDQCIKTDGSIGTMRPTLDHPFCCMDGTCVPRSGFQYSELPINPGPDPEPPEIPNMCAETAETCLTTRPCCDTTANICGHKCLGDNDATNYCYPVGTADVVPATNTDGCNLCAESNNPCSAEIECCDTEEDVCGHFNSGSDFCYPKDTADDPSFTTIGGTSRDVGSTCVSQGGTCDPNLAPGVSSSNRCCNIEGGNYCDPGTSKCTCYPEGVYVGATSGCCAGLHSNSSTGWICVR